MTAIKSMTGFGRATARAGDGPDAAEATVEVRSVNGRFAEVTVRAPRVLAADETVLVARVKERLERGHATVTVTLAAGPDAPGGDAAVRAAADRLRALRTAAGLSAEEAPITLADLLRVADAPAGTPEPDADAAREAAAAALDAALDALDAMRRAEGAALASDLSARADAVEALVESVEARAPVRVREARARLADRLALLLADAPPDARRVDPARLEAEVALLADKLDVSEECVRLRSHLAQFRAALAAPEAVGRRLGFLAQEFGREVNTIGSKANDAETARLSVAMKEVLEQIREQVANVL